MVDDKLVERNRKRLVTANNDIWMNGQILLRETFT